jgi:hypothetical protein
LSTPRTYISIWPRLFLMSAGPPVKSPPSSTQFVQCVQLIWRMWIAPRLLSMAARWMRLQSSTAERTAHESLGGSKGISSSWAATPAAQRSKEAPLRIVAALFGLSSRLGFDFFSQ